MCERTNGLILGAVCELLNRVIALEGDLGTLDDAVDEEIYIRETADDAFVERVDLRDITVDAKIDSLVTADATLSSTISDLEERVLALEVPA